MQATAALHQPRRLAGESIEDVTNLTRRHGAWTWFSEHDDVPILLRSSCAPAKPITVLYLGDHDPSVRSLAQSCRFFDIYPPAHFANRNAQKVCGGGRESPPQDDAPPPPKTLGCVCVTAESVTGPRL
jgi:hypothetical protein